jgi:hypothetical protein
MPDKAQRIAANIAKLPGLIGRRRSLPPWKSTICDLGHRNNCCQEVLHAVGVPSIRRGSCLCSPAPTKELIPSTTMA